MSYDPYADDPEAAADAEADAFLNYILGGQSEILGGFAPYMNEVPYMSLSGLVPGYAGEDEQLDFNKSAVNYIQDLAQLSMDPYYAGFAGAAAFAPGTLEPRVSTTVVDRPNYRRVAALAAGDPDSYEGRIAQALLDGYPGSSALREIYAELDQYEPESDEWLAATRRMNLPTTQDQGATVLDEIALRSRASELETSLFEDPQPGTSEAVYDPQTGELVSSGGERFLEQDPNTGEMVLMERTVEESPLAEHYREAGLPLPTDQFTPELIMGPEWAAQTQALTREPVDVAEAAYWDALQNYLDYEGPAGAPPDVRGMTGGRPTPAAPPNYDVLSSGWPGTGTSISQAGIANTASVAQPGGAPLAPSTDILDVVPGGTGMPAGSVQPAPGTPAAAISEVIALGDPSDVEAWMTQVYPTLRPEDRVAVDAIVASAAPAAGGDGGAGGGLGVGQYAQSYTAPGGADIAALLGRQLAPQGGEQPTPPGSTGNPDLDRALGINQLPPLDPNAPIMSAQPGGPVAPPPGPRPPAMPPNQGGFAPDINLTPQGGLAGPPAGDRTQDAMLAALLGGGPLTGQPGWQAAPDRGVALGVTRSAPDEQMRRAMLAAAQWPGQGLPQPPPQPPPTYLPDVDERRAQAQRVAMERALIQAGGSPSDLPWTTYAQPPAVAPAGAADPFLDALVEYGRTGQVPGQPQSNYPPISQMLDVLGGGTGQITPANYGGGPVGAPPSDAMRAAVLPTSRRGGGPAGGTQLEQWLANATARPRRSGRVATGEERQTQRSQAEREAANQLAWDVADPRTEWLRQDMPRRRNAAREAWMGQRRQYYDESARLYGKGSGFGKAMALAYTAQQRGITPYVATVAARQQVPMAAGINTPGRVY